MHCVYHRNNDKIIKCQHSELNKINHTFQMFHLALSRVFSITQPLNYTIFEKESTYEKKHSWLYTIRLVVLFYLFVVFLLFLIIGFAPVFYYFFFKKKHTHNYRRWEYKKAKLYCTKLSVEVANKVTSWCNYIITLDWLIYLYSNYSTHNQNYTPHHFNSFLFFVVFFVSTLWPLFFFLFFYYQYTLFCMY